MKFVIFAFLVLLVSVGASIPRVGGWKDQDVSKINSDSEVMQVLNFGLESALVRAQKDHKLLSSEGFKIQKVISYQIQVVSGLNYRFNVALEGPDGKDVNLTFVVFDQSWTGTIELMSYEIKN